MPPTHAALEQHTAAIRCGSVAPADFWERTVLASGAVKSESLFRSLLVNHVDIRTPELHVRALTLHRHVTEEHVIVSPQHRWCHAILHLSGWGQQVFSNECADVEPGVMVMLPPGQMYSFHPSSNCPAVCLVIDFQLKRAAMPVRRICVISRGELAQTREQIGHLLRMQSKASVLVGWESATVVLKMVIRFLRASGWLERAPPVAVNGCDSPLHRMLLTMELESPLQQIVSRSGYQRDHLNRLVKKETGLTLGQFRAQRRLAKAKELLACGVKVGDVAHSVGLPDPSYFARWFRQQTGQSPSHWRLLELDAGPMDFVSRTGPREWSDDGRRKVCVAG